MKFYPIVYTRTALCNLAKGRNGVDFIYRALPPGFVGSPLENLMRQTINEDRFDEITTPRRVFYRTENRVFWGLALHNEFFLPSEICEALELSEGERKLRGFWGGTIELNDGDVLSNETLNLIAATLESREADSALPDDAVSLFEAQTSECQTFVGRSPFVFASRLFQRFVQKDWTNTKVPKRVGERNLNFAPLISETPFDLRFFAPEPNETSEVAPFHVEASQLLASTDFSDVDATNALWRRLVFAANERLRVVAPLTCENHADRCVSSDFELDATALLDASGVRVYCPKAPPQPKEKEAESPTEKNDDAFDAFPGDLKSTSARDKKARCDRFEELLEEIRTFFRKFRVCFVRLRPCGEKVERRSQRRRVEVETFEQRAKRQIAEIDRSFRGETGETSRARDEINENKKTRRFSEEPKIDFYAGRRQDSASEDADNKRQMF
ncbi:MAG: hypothetical protein IJE77_13445 [Thermoguttaceae bacterium]|nr:hypothetical protein [Thermoguttaceae bacterium]MBQ9798758.1 hypothetical protein [Thermoguttaceae bacterium]